MSLPLRHLSRRFFNSLLYTSKPRFQPKSTSTSKPTPSSTTRINALLARLPAFTRPYTSSLRTAPASFITSFLILHEITAIVPLVGFAALFHWVGWVPEKWTEVRHVERFGRWFGRRGWFGFEPQSKSEQDVGEDGKEGIGEEEVVERWGVSAGSGRILVEVATAYALTKVLLPVRVVVSVWAAPWFARTVVRRVGRVVGRGRKGVERSVKPP